MNHSMLFLFLAFGNVFYQLIVIWIGKEPDWHHCFTATYFQAYAIFVCWWFKYIGVLK